MKYKSKIDWWFYLVVAVFILVPLLVFINAVVFPSLSNSFLLLIGAVFAVLLILVILPMYFFTYYTLKDELLIVRGGFCCYKRIPYTSIEKITETRQPWSSAALSYDRIEILYSKGLGVVYISPKDKKDFIEQLNKRIDNKGSELAQQVIGG